MNNLKRVVLLVITISYCFSPSHQHRPPRLSLLQRGIRKKLENEPTSISKGFTTYFYDQTLDHFNYNPQSYTTFKQRYDLNFKHWGGSPRHAPIFAFLGDEAALGRHPRVGFMMENAPRFRALQVYIEHRFYGESNPLGSMKKSLQNATIRGYFNSAQALADYAEILIYLKNKLSAHNSPIIVIGGSYGGQLAVWFRLKYPHVAHGALASSAPILYFDDITPQDAYYSVVSKDFWDVSESCYKTIQKSWLEIDKIASKPHGLAVLSKKFNTCRQLRNCDELKEYLDRMYAGTAQYDDPPTYPVTQVCGGIDGAPKGTDILGRIVAGINAYLEDTKCRDTDYTPSYETYQGWNWQTCSELVMPIDHGYDTMFWPSNFSLSEWSKHCRRSFGVEPRPHWITTYYGGQDIKLILKKFASNIIFSNGLRDPYSSGGVLQNISDSLVAVVTTNGSHCLDLESSKPDDPEWLVTQRKTVFRIIRGWIKEYYATLSATHKLAL
ncbi:Lysosomal Pro-X carboxypeptidase [Heracleum sosnowskyi]|uniref:Lysosomal Pro-X carboxypeptidase n=1 Tax=Heracleum sosnowskyi TaxID=360622 RepID=A0AAD8HEX1_9APIA|nr:Lysosomal Pro-X carboxypeptidase [Heracleum sosnowskyi]KAK1364817.1 Lysosomal Pro-X carboxypeptidase [Heracleum sosnowskyi]